MPRIPGIDKTGQPIGAIVSFSGSTLPTGTLLCDGSAVSRTTYNFLFAAIGTTWGVGDGSTTFNLPDHRGRTAIGHGTGSGLTTRTLGTQNIGEENHTLGVGEIPGHTHNVTISGSTGSVNTDHSHTITFGGTGGLTGTLPYGGGGPGFPQTTSTGAMSANQNHTHTFSGSSTTDSGTPGGSSHNNIQPSLVTKFCIAYI